MYLLYKCKYVQNVNVNNEKIPKKCLLSIFASYICKLRVVDALVTEIKNIFRQYRVFNIILISVRRGILSQGNIYLY